MQSAFLLGRLSDTYINLAIGVGSGDAAHRLDGEMLLHLLRSPESFAG